MHLISLYRVIRTALKSFWRNRWLTLAATLIMCLTLVTISFFISLLFVTNKTTEALRSKVDMSVYFEDTTSKDQIFALQNLLLSRSDVKSVEYVSKEKALELWRERYREEKELRDVVSETDNPLPRSLEIKTQKLEDLENINELLSSSDYKPLIKTENGISYKKNKDVIDRLVRITSFIKLAGWNMSFIFMLISVLIIYNTIRLTIFARREEIEIMKLVGASDWYVRGPFIIEGVGYGIIAAIFSTVIYYFALIIAMPKVEQFLGVYNLSAQYFGLSIWFIAFLQVAIGLGLGSLCSLMAVRNHLK
ncbi:MAG: Cell division protein FtsX [bacterium ADurb.Bin400]|nr:MAG: Cell division protein FtsX [bacterium ADurb.Bin400]